MATNSSIKLESLKPTPLRPVADFLLDSKRYISPPVSDLKRLNNRVTSNLLYYQTNYFGVSAVFFLIFLFFGFNKMIGGVFGVSTVAAAALFALDKIPQLKPIKRQYPIAVPGAGVLSLIVVYCAFRPVLYFLLAVLIPIAGWIIHASMRSRGLKNKINNKAEQLGGQVYANSPMGIVLSTLGIEAKESDD